MESIIRKIAMDEAALEDFKKLDIRTATIVSVEDHPNASKLYVLKVDLGNETRQLVAGIKSSYTKEDLINKKIVMIANLKPAILRGVESNGMLLAADDNGNIAVLTPDKNVSNGIKIR